MLRTALAALVLAAASSSVLAEIKLAPIFSDHMVVQRGVASPVWGTTTPGARVELFLEEGKPVGTTVANDKGFFRAKLPVLEEGKVHRITVKAGDDSVTLSDVLVGEVWVCSGQSNMQWSVWDSADRDNEVKGANHPNIRLFSVPRKTSDEPRDTFVLADGASSPTWQVCSPETIGGFSAVAYSFGRKLNGELNVPIGLIHTSWGGTIAETWTPKATIASLAHLPGVADLSRTLKESLEPAGRERLQKIVDEWNAAKDKLLEAPSEAAKDWMSVELDESGWKTTEQPGDWIAIENANGLGWLRKTIDVPAELAGKDMKLSLGRVDDYDVTYVNGEKVGSTLPSTGDAWNRNRVYTVPGTLVKAGKNVIAVRVLDTGGAAGLAGPAGAMKIVLAADESKFIPLNGPWLFKLEQALDVRADPRPANPADPDNPNMPSRLYNAMIHPLGDVAIRGAIWYQGESNASRHAEYEQVMTGMIRAWREQFTSADGSDFPFYQVGLANFMAPTDDPNKPSNWARLREAQRQVGRNVNNAGMTVTIDIGEEKDIHPKNKQDVGKRLALMALEETYGKTLVSRGPTLKSIEFREGQAIVHFDHVGSGLMAKESLEKSFSLAGEDGKFAWADATIEGNTVVLRSREVTSPTQVRYAFADNPRATLFNKEGLPAEPFEAKDAGPTTKKAGDGEQP